jgi:hypothetical protein
MCKLTVQRTIPYGFYTIEILGNGYGGDIHEGAWRLLYGNKLLSYVNYYSRRNNPYSPLYMNNIDSQIENTILNYQLEGLSIMYMTLYQTLKEKVKGKSGAIKLFNTLNKYKEANKERSGFIRLLNGVYLNKDYSTDNRYRARVSTLRYGDNSPEAFKATHKLQLIQILSTKALRIPNKTGLFRQDTKYPTYQSRLLEAVKSINDPSIYPLVNNLVYIINNFKP